MSTFLSLRTVVNKRTLLNRFFSESVKKKATSSSSGEVKKRIILSGIQPTGAIHLGNYLGAIRQWVELQNNKEDLILSIVDLHSITLPQNPSTLQSNILELTATLLACGISPDNTLLFLQSSVPHHTQLCWVLQCITSMARLSRLPQYKEKSEGGPSEVPLGLYVYPVLQAADILLYRATHVPVGQDQLQHLQMAQQIVTTFNHRFGKTFSAPQPILADESVTRIKSLRNPSKKMSKSDPDIKSRILLSDSDEVIHNKFRKAVTDFTPEITYDPESRPGISNMVNIHSGLTGDLPEEICEEVDGKDTLAYKRLVADVVCEHVAPIRERIQQYLREPNYLVSVLREGAEQARRRAQPVYQEVEQRVGLGIPHLHLENKDRKHSAA